MFSVLLSIYYKESAKHLAQALNSISEQTFRPNEIILIEDGPLTPELNSIITSYKTSEPALKVISLPQNQGLGKALNEGLKHCTYDLVARMDTDDIGVIRASRNIPKFSTMPVAQISTYEVVANAVVVLTKGAVEKIEEVYGA